MESKSNRVVIANNFEQCMKCTICTVYCPVSSVTSDYPGPKQAGPDGERLRLKEPGFFDESLKYCLNCKRCEVACPSGVRIGDIIQSARIRYTQTPPKFRDKVLANTDIVGAMATKLAPVVNAVVGMPITKRLMDTFCGIDSHRTFPRYSCSTFERLYNRLLRPKQDSFINHVSYFHGCYVNYNYPKLGMDLIKVMNAVGYGVHLLDDEHCCGVALISNRLIDKAIKKAETNLRQIRKSVTEKHRPVITTSSTCTMTIRDEYPNILGLSNDDVRESTEMATRFLFRLVDSGKIKLAFKPDYKCRLAYHTACHVEKLGWAVYATSLLRMIPGVDLVILDSQCCGIAGTYGFKRENYDVSQAIGKPLFRQIEDADADYVVTDCETCKWQIEMSTHVKVKNPISILAEAIDYEKTAAINGGQSLDMTAMLT